MTIYDSAVNAYLMAKWLAVPPLPKIGIYQPWHVLSEGDGEHEPCVIVAGLPQPIAENIVETHNAWLAGRESERA